MVTSSGAIVILLDLNYTLVKNSDQKRSPFSKQIQHELYRQDLVEFMKCLDHDHYVILITARPRKYERQTIESIAQKTGMEFSRHIFNHTNLSPHLFKRQAFLTQIRPAFPNARFVAIESNPRTIAEYKKLGVLCLSVQ